MFQPDLSKEEAFKFSRFDPESPLSSCSAHPIVLEDKNWLTCEHYFSSKILRSASLAHKVENTHSALAAAELAAPWYRFKIRDYKKLRAVLMTRALYTKVQMYDEVKEALLATGDELLLETSLYDYYWGVGRDGRGLNTMGKVWMDIRSKLKDA
ncbi:NADAR family protein [Agaribacterium sp. ZY112]|uniref:NADAR family protein n=1 Tax=Agaribacterium sp. ZY112 TaxID=3233574 RepID=UPI003525FAC7